MRYHYNVELLNKKYMPFKRVCININIYVNVYEVLP